MTTKHDDHEHGFVIYDPFRYLEDDTEASRHFEAEQHHKTIRALHADTFWEPIYQRLDTLMTREETHVPQARQDVMAFLRRQPGANQATLECLPPGHTHSQTIYDPGRAELPQAIDWFTLSEDGKFVLFGVSNQGDEWSTLYIYDWARNRLLDDTIPGTRWASVFMPMQKSVFYYTRYPVDAKGHPQYYGQRVYCHRLGTDYHDDREVFSDPDPTTTFRLTGDQEGRQLVIETHRGWTANRLSLLTLNHDALEPSMIMSADIFDGTTERLEPFWRRGELFGLYHHPTEPSQIWKWNSSDHQWIPLWVSSLTDPVQSIVPLDSGFVLFSFHQARCHLAFLHDDGEMTPIDLPHQGMGTVLGLQADASHDRVFIEWTSFDQPPQVYSWSVLDPELKIWGTQFKSTQGIRIWQEFVKSKDGTLIPIFLAQKQGLPTGVRPAIVGGYGGFNIAYQPIYSPGIHLWLESGGLYVVAGLRGGSEFGEAWHQAGMRDRKQNVFDDMVSVLRHLVAEGYSRPDMMGITGRSNGGLLTGTIVTQHPELIRSAIIGVPLLDMLRYDRFLVAALWKREYGDPNNPVDWQWLQRYSPYHHVVPHTKYPAILIFTSAHDNRVHPLHARKMTARLQQATGSSYPIFLRVEPQAGHGVGKTRKQQLEEETDIWTFQFRQLGLSPHTSSCG
ncbi:prolyl oligopeptidase family serine peptidase [Sulfobacillus thermosulfidooxidans]|uniref:prolyl oligopeptidase family serine peptidase n=1 Tax=Sulfobacillus thermosulfidooxidans TaxID=28034 RepID=UPI0013011572|nr:prolyl oligopeptidase family serine peptidase [Sulfobacillus thermosulfidooxidans]